MKKTLLFIFAAASTVTAAAQGISRMESELRQSDWATGAAVEVTVADDAATPLRIADMNGRRSSVTIYAVGIYRDNSQDGRANAAAAQSRFAEMWPGTDVRLTYENPWFWVTAGNFVDRTDAVALAGSVAGQFPRAVIRQQEVSTSEFIAREKARATASNTDENTGDDNE